MNHPRLHDWLAHAPGTAPAWVRRLAIGAYLRVYGIDLDEAVVPDEGFDDLQSLFVRQPKPSARPVATDPDVVVSPVDGVVCGRAEATRDALPPVFGPGASLATLLAEVPTTDLDVVALYLAPSDLHRVWSPTAGTTETIAYRPGRRLPVIPALVRRLPGGFTRHERCVLRVLSRGRRWWMVWVGASGVGHLDARFLPPGRPDAPYAGRPTIPRVSQGEDLGAFRLGSTVVLAAEHGAWSDLVAEGERVRLGAPLGRWTPPGP